MAKEQNLSLNPTKISGNCSRLMCCLKYEQDAYEDLLKNTPSVGSLVKTPEGKGRVVEVNLLRGLLKVHYESDAEGVSHVVHADEVKVLKSAHVHIDESELKELKELEE